MLPPVEDLSSSNMEASFLALLLASALSAAFSNGQHTVHMDSGCHGVYYDGLGCFSRDFPFNNTRELPQTPGFVDTTFHLFTRRNPHNAQVLSARQGAQNLGGSIFNPRLGVKVLIHGFLQNDRNPWVLEMTHALLAQDNVNVITVSWGAGAGFPYTQAAANTRVVGAELARLVFLLKQQRGASYRKFHLIGHSLGSHVAGHAGRALRGKLARITGLDPADPSFSHQPPEVRLDPTDARWVDVIHTDGGPFTTYSGYGTLQSMGHIDFYPNGGKNQPGCHTDTSMYSFVRDAYQIGMTNAEYAMACSHDRSIHLFLQSIPSTRGCTFTAYPCASEDDFRAGRCLSCGNRPCPTMGYRAEVYKREGTFYLDTFARPSFCGYHYLVRVKVSNSASGQLHVQVRGQRGQTVPLLLHDGAFSADQTLSAVLLAADDVGHVTGATLTYIPGNGYFSWFSSPSLQVTAVSVEGVHRRNTLYFCPRTSAVQPGQPVSLTDGTASPGQCFQP